MFFLLKSIFSTLLRFDRSLDNLILLKNRYKVNKILKEFFKLADA